MGGAVCVCGGGSVCVCGLRGSVGVWCGVCVGEG